MNEVDDPRVEFYLKHQNLIDEWAAVRSDARDEAHRFYLSLFDDLDALAQDLDSAKAGVTDDNWSRVYLYREEWTQPDADPIAMVCLEWRHATFVDGNRVVGVRIDASHEAGKALRRRVGDQVRDMRANAGFGDRSSYYAASKTPPTPEGEYWTHLSAYRATLVELISDAWDAFAERIDRAFSETSPILE